MTLVALIIGAILALLGALWLSQGLGLVTIEPILCFANCTPVEGPDLAWTIAGALALTAGILAIRFGIRRRRNR